MKLNIFSIAARSLAIKFTIFILALLLIIISLLIWLNLRGTIDIVNNQNVTFIDNSQDLIQKNFDYAITQITDLLNKQFTETTEMMTSSLTQATIQKGKAVISNLSGQIGNAIANYDFGFGVTAFNEIFKNDETVVYAGLIDNSKNAMFYKVSGSFLPKKKSITSENFFENSELEGKTIKDALIDGVFKNKRGAGEQYTNTKFKIKIYKIAQPIIINNELWGVVVLGFSLENLSREIENMQKNFLAKIDEEKKRLEGEAGTQKNYEIDKISANLAIIREKIRNNIQQNAYLYFVMFSVPGLFLAYIFGKNIARPIIAIVPYIQKISQGILTDKIKLKRNDEIKILADGINAMVDELNNMIKTINNIIQSITSENNNLLHISSETTSTINTISNNINEIEVGVINNSMDVQATAERLKRFVTTLEEMTENALTLDQSAQQTEHSTIKGKENFAKLLDKMNSIETGYKETYELVNTLQKFSLEIKDILQTIEDISTRTRMLAYSVNVIAQKGGQQDSSISNIASEVRNLSKFIADYSANIMKIIDNNNVLIGKISNSTKIGIKNIEEGILTSNELMGTMNEIYVKVTSDKVMISSMSDMIENIDGESKTIFSSTENISQVTSQMSSLISSTAKAIYEERETLKQLNVSVNKLNSIAESLKDKMKEFVINE